MEFRQLQHFVAAAKAEHFTRAAGRLNIVQSALSSSIRSLEEELGVQLFVRTTRSVRLTSAGRALLAKAEVVFDAIADARAAVRAVAQGDAGRLTIGAVHSLPAFLNIPTVLGAFNKSFPQVDVRLTQGSAAHLLEKLRNGLIDFAILPVFEPRDDIRTHVLACEELVAVAASGFVWPSAESVRLEDLSEVSFVEFAQDIGSRRLSDQAFERALVERRVAYEVGDLGTLLNLVEEGLGIALVPQSVIAARQGRLVSRPVAGMSLCWEIVVAHHTRKAIDPVWKRLIDLLEDQSGTIAQA